MRKNHQAETASASRKRETDQAKITINDNYYFTADRRNLTLYRTGMKNAIGYFTRYELMISRIIYLNSIEASAKEENIHITRYLEILKQERERIEKLFEGVQAPARG
jgi:hypothetical protein